MAKYYIASGLDVITDDGEVMITCKNKQAALEKAQRLMQEDQFNHLFGEMTESEIDRAIDNIVS